MPYSALFSAIRSIPRYECFGIFISELTRQVERRFPNQSPLKENSARAWTLIASRSIYKYTGDVVSGSLACAMLISYLISPHETPILVFITWAIFLFAYYLIPRLMANLLRFCISILFVIIGVILSDSSLFEALWSALFWNLSKLPVILIIYANATLVMMLAFLFRSLAHKLRSIPRHEGFGNLVEELTCIVEWRFPNSSPLAEITARTLTLVVSRSIYRCTRDVITGSLSCTILISFLISHDETPIYVFIIWGMCQASYLKNNRELIPGD